MACEEQSSAHRCTMSTGGLEALMMPLSACAPATAQNYNTVRKEKELRLDKERYELVRSCCCSTGGKAAMQVGVGVRKVLRAKQL